VTALTLDALLAANPVVPVVTIADAGQAVALGEALLAGGVSAIEVVLRTPDALKALEAIAKALPEAEVGAGTLLSGDDVRRAVDAGARFGVSPGLTPEIADAAQATGLALLPGVQTLSEAMAARARGFRLLKLFPANIAGGVGWLKAVAPVLQDLRFCPTGGIQEADVAGYLAQPNCAAVGGSWVVPGDRLAAGDFAAITALAKRASAFAAARKAA
jgi:2-dehydro-3-deoxyphosphogluconate aldolase/(4S)-4-hydroxy-2-oxoglutarate aldolase